MQTRKEALLTLPKLTAYRLARITGLAGLLILVHPVCLLSRLSLLYIMASLARSKP